MKITDLQHQYLLELSQKISDLKEKLENIDFKGDGGYISGVSGHLSEAEIDLDTAIYLLTKQ